MKKKLLSLLLASVTALSVAGGLAACNNRNGSGGIDTDDVLDIPSGALTLKIWCADEAIEAYTGMVAEFKEKHEEAKDWTVTFEGKGEADASSAIRTDPETGANIYFMASDQISKQIQAKALQPLPELYANKIVARDTEGAVSAIHLPDPDNNNAMEYWAFPNANSNGYFLYYDKNALSDDDVKSLDRIVAKAESMDKKILFDYNNGFYAPSFFFGMGVGLGDEASNYENTLETDAGYEAGRTFLKYFGSGASGVFAKPNGNQTAVSFAAGTAIASVSGTWENSGDALYKMADETEGWTRDRLGFAKLPMFTDTTGASHQMGSFMGAKYTAVNPARPENEILASLALADFFNQKEGQIKYYLATGNAPTHKEAAEDSRVTSDPILTALIAQNAAGGHMQLSTPSKFWDAFTAFGDGVYGGTTTATTINSAIDALSAALNQ